jgi:hypothetical protein
VSAEEQRRAAQREEAGLPVFPCPNCGMLGARHFIAASLDDYGLVVPGYFTCEAKA